MHVLKKKWYWCKKTSLTTTLTVFLTILDVLVIEVSKTGIAHETDDSVSKNIMTHTHAMQSQ